LAVQVAQFSERQAAFSALAANFAVSDALPPPLRLDLHDFRLKKHALLRLLRPLRLLRL
jgi:hypothetical protein